MPAPARQVVDRDGAERLLGQQPLGGGEDGQLPVVAGGPRRAAAARGRPAASRARASGTGEEYPRAPVSQHRVDSFDSASITSVPQSSAAPPRSRLRPARPLECTHGHRARGRPDRRRRAVRHRRRLPPAGGVPGQELRDPRVARRHRRHLGPLPLPGHPVGLRHVHPRLRLPAVEGLQGHRRRRGDPAATSRTPPASTASRRRSASTTRCSPPTGRAPTPAGP